MFYFEFPATESVLPVAFPAEPTGSDLNAPSFYDIQIGDVPLR